MSGSRAKIIRQQARAQGLGRNGYRKLKKQWKERGR